MNKLSPFYSAINRGNSPLRIASHACHEGFQVSLAKCNTEWMFIPSPEGKTWDADYRKMPNNIIEISQEQFNKMDFIDLTMSHTIQQIQGMQKMSDFFGIKHINLNHIYPNPSFNDRYIKTINESRKDAVKVFTTEHQANEWGYGASECEIIGHGVDTDHFKDWTTVGGKIISVANFYQDRGDELGYDIYLDLVRNLGKDKFFHIGKSSNNSSEAAKNYNHLASLYQVGYIFINTCHRSVLPTTLVEAMSTGMPVVTKNNPTIDKLIVNGENGFKVENSKEMTECITMLINNRDLAFKIGKGARKTAIEKYNMDKFIGKWDTLLKRNIKT